MSYQGQPGLKPTQMPRLPFTIQLFLVLALLEGGPVLLFGLWTGHSRGIEAEQQFDRMAYQQAVNTRDAVLAFVHMKEEVLGVVAGTASTIDPWSQEALQGIADAQLTASGSFDAFMIANQRGLSVVLAPSVRADGSKTRAGVDYSDRSYYQELVRTGRTAFGEIALGKQSKLPNIHIAVPVLYPGDAPPVERIRGLVGAGIRTDLLLDVARVTLGHKGADRVVITDNKGRVVIDTTARLKPFYSVAPYPISSDQCSPAGVDLTDDDGILVRATCAPLVLGTQIWSVWASAPRIDLELEAKRAQNTIRYASSLIILFSLIFSGWASTRFGVWIQGAARLAGRVGAGQFNIQIPEPRWYHPREADQMSRVVRQTLQRLRAHDDKVSELVSELKTVNRKLQPFADAWSEVHDAIEILSPAATLMFVNPAYSNLMGSDEDEIGRPSSLLTPHHPDDDVCPDLLAKAIRGEPWQIQVKVKVKGHTRIHDINLSPVLDDQGGLRRVIVVRRDITEVRQAQAAAAHNDRLAALGTLAAGLAHEINNPLTYIQMSLEMVREEQIARQDDSEDARELRQANHDAIKGVEQVGTIVRDMLTLARAGSTIDNPVLREQISLSEVIQACVTIARPKLLSGAQLSLQIENTPMVWGLKSELIQVVLNLLINAIQAMESQPKDLSQIEIRTGLMDEGKVWLEVEDNGPGIPEPNIEHIFEPFYTSKPVGQGVGLGLAVSQSIIQRMGGLISVHSIRGQGACFRLELNAVSDSAAEKPKDISAKSMSTKSGRILIIDDDPLVARSIKRMLRRYQVTTIQDGSTALELAAREDFDLIICDVMMPGMDGPTVYENLCLIREDLAQRFVFLTGAAKGSQVRDALGATGRRVLSKPVTQAQLEEVVIKFTA